MQQSRGGFSVLVGCKGRSKKIKFEGGGRLGQVNQRRTASGVTQVGTRTDGHDESSCEQEKGQEKLAASQKPGIRRWSRRSWNEGFSRQQQVPFAAPQGNISTTRCTHMAKKFAARLCALALTRRRAGAYAVVGNVVAVYSCDIGLFLKSAAKVYRASNLSSFSQSSWRTRSLTRSAMPWRCPLYGPRVTFLRGCPQTDTYIGL